MSKLKLTALIVFIVLLIFLTIGLWPDRNRAGIFGSRANIQTGEKFGIKIGQDRKAAITYLSSLGLVKGDNSYTRQYSKSGSEMCHGKEFSDGHKIDLLVDKSWRRGNICIASLNEKVIHISWDYGMLNP